MSWVECVTPEDIEIAYTHLNSADYKDDVTRVEKEWCGKTQWDLLNQKTVKIFYSKNDKGITVSSIILMLIHNEGEIGRWFCMGCNYNRNDLNWEEADNLTYPFFKSFIEENGEIVFTTNFVESAGIFLDVDGKRTPHPSELTERIKTYGIEIVEWTTITNKVYNIIKVI